MFLFLWCDTDRAGTGLLSMMAAKAMDSTHTMENNGGEGMVSACESYLPMFKLMRKIIRANCMERKIRVFCKRSDELKVSLDLPSRADILVRNTNIGFLCILQLRFVIGEIFSDPQLAI